MGIIRVLSPETARLIAAGEVIDRPASALRELLDNAIDAGALEISVRIEDGGIGLIRVVDNGSGMDREDLELSALAHATSKIREADDLLTARTLGFRGEALASIAATARLEILSATEDARSAARLVAGPGFESRIESAAGRRGTTVKVTNLFADFPARRRFLKRPQAEASLCRQVFADKAMAHPELLFRFESGSGSPEMHPPQDRCTRVASFFSELPRSLLHELTFSGAGFEGNVVIAGPATARADRRLMQTFVNRRRVQEWSLLQALDYAFSGYLPGGLHPAAFLFLEIDPALADFNIHPAKREVRFKDPEAHRRALVRAVQDFLSELLRRDPAQTAPSALPELELLPIEDSHPGYRPAASASGWSGQIGGFSRGSGSESYRGGAYDGASFRADSGPRSWADFDAVRERAREGAGSSGVASDSVAEGAVANGAPAGAARDPANDVSGRGASFRYLGQALGPFLLFEMGEELWFLDQHAAHERLIFDELTSRRPDSQELLVPERIESEDEAEDEGIAAATEDLAAAGFRVLREGGAFLVTAAPSLLARDAAGAARELARARSAGSDAVRATLAMAACRAAVKDGDLLDREAAESLIARALSLPEPRCPHGRPIWSRITRDQMYRAVRRIVD